MKIHSKLGKNSFGKLRFYTTENMKKNILSLDIGIKNLAYCFFDSNEKKILKWGKKNLTNPNNKNFIMSVVDFFENFEKEEKNLFDGLGTVLIEQQVRGNMRIIEAIVYTKFHSKMDTNIINTKSVKKYFDTIYPVKSAKNLSSSAKYRQNKHRSVEIVKYILDQRKQQKNREAIDVKIKEESNDKDQDVEKNQQSKNAKKDTKKEHQLMLMNFPSLVNDTNKWRSYFDRHTKKDDLSDSLLQAIYFAERPKDLPLKPLRKSPKKDKPKEDVKEEETAKPKKSKKIKKESDVKEKIKKN